MPVCPNCGKPMAVSRVISVAGVQNKEVSWRCAEDEVEVGAVHPVQIAHLHVGDEREEQDGRRSRIVKLEMTGAELFVFRKMVTAGERIGHSDA